MHLETQIKTNKSFIYRSLLKYGYSNFRLEILEYCDPDKTLNREQAFLDLLQPHYNILKKAGSLLGFRHSEETIAKLKTQSWTEERKAAKRLWRLKILDSNKELREKSQKNILKYNLSRSKKVEVLDTLKNETTVYSSINKASRAIGCSHPSIIYALKKLQEKGVNGLIKGRYQVKPLNK